MNIVEKVLQVSEKKGPDFKKCNNFLKIEAFHKKAVESGVVKKPEYNFPQIDTIGGMVFNLSKK